MLGMFVVMGVIAGVTVLLNYLFKPRKKDSE